MVKHRYTKLSVYKLSSSVHILKLNKCQHKEQ